LPDQVDLRTRSQARQVRGAAGVNRKVRAAAGKTGRHAYLTPKRVNRRHARRRTLAAEDDQIVGGIRPVQSPDAPGLRAC
jgi:hypothetical protein